LLPKRH